METIEIARRLAELNEHRDACRAYQLALEEGQEPAVSMEAAIYILQFGTGDDYRISYSIFYDLHRKGFFQEDIPEIMREAFYEPNVNLQKKRYRDNCKLLSKYPYLFRKDFPDFDRLPIRFYPFDDNSYTPYDLRMGRFGDYINPKDPVIRHYFFKDLEKPVLAEDIFSQYELEYLRDNVRKSEYIGRENHVYLHYSDWETFCAYLAVLDLRPILREEKVVVLIGEELSQYPIDFKERFGVDYSKFPVKPLGIREIQRMIWHTQLATHNGGDFFNEVFDEHPNLLTETSLVFSSVEDTVEALETQLRKISSRQELREVFERWPDMRIVEELYSLRDRTPKDILVAIYFRDGAQSGGSVHADSRIVPAVFFQPHFPNINYRVNTDAAGHAALFSEQYDQIINSALFRHFKYIKTFTPMRRITNSCAATIRFVYPQTFPKSDGEVPSNLSDEIINRVLNRSFMVDWQNRLFKDCVLVRFEDGKLNPKATFTALAEFLDVPYTKSMTYCSEGGRLDPHPETKGFDPVSVYRTYDEFANRDERYFLEYFFRDAYEYYGYGFQYYDGAVVDETRVKELLEGFTVIDRYIRESWGRVFAALQERNEKISQVEKESIRQKQGRLYMNLEYFENMDELGDYLLQPHADPQALLEGYMERVHERRREVTKVLLGGLQFVNRQGQPLHMMPKLKLDMALLEQPLYK